MRQARRYEGASDTFRIICCLGIRGIIKSLAELQLGSTIFAMNSASTVGMPDITASSLALVTRGSGRPFGRQGCSGFRDLFAGRSRDALRLDY